MFSEPADLPEERKIASTLVRAAVRHSAACCGGTIRIGEYYRRDLWIVDGEPLVYCFHVRACNTIAGKGSSCKRPRRRA